MKKIIGLFWLVVLVFIAKGQGIQFETGSFRQVLEKAKAEKKVVFIDVYAVWCGPCKRMSSTVFKDAEVGKFMNEHFVSIKIDSERGEGPSIKTRYAIEGLPGYLFLTPEGNVVYRAVGAMSAEKFMGVLKSALASANNPNNIAQLAERYAHEKNNEQFLRLYLDELKNSKAGAHYEEVEQYLKVQKSMSDTSGEMVHFLYEHANSLIFGGEAEGIIKENFGSEEWDLYARKEIRETFQKIFERMAKNTTEYAILKRDTSFITLSIRKALSFGIKFPEDQKDRLMIYYYQQIGDGELYKQAVTPRIKSFVQSLNIQELKKGHEAYMKQIAASPELRGRSFAQKNCEILRHMVAEYSCFVNTAEEKRLLKEWADVAIEILPAEPKNIVFNAKVLYVNGEQEKAIKIMENAIENGELADEGNKKDLEIMKEGGEIRL